MSKRFNYMVTFAAPNKTTGRAFIDISCKMSRRAVLEIEEKLRSQHNNPKICLTGFFELEEDEAPGG